MSTAPKSQNAAELLRVVEKLLAANRLLQNDQAAEHNRSNNEKRNSIKGEPHTPNSLFAGLIR